MRAQGSLSLDFAYVVDRGVAAVDAAPFLALWRSVLMLAISDYLYLSERQAPHVEARTWIFDGERGWPGFGSLCLLFGIDPDNARSALRAKRKARMRPVHFKRQRVTGARNRWRAD